jgi:hypothetical protein
MVGSLVPALAQDAPPAAVTLQPPAAGDEPNTVYVFWSQSQDSDFSEYRFYRAMHPDVTYASHSDDTRRTTYRVRGIRDITLTICR